MMMTYHFDWRVDSFDLEGHRSDGVSVSMSIRAENRKAAIQKLCEQWKDEVKESDDPVFAANFSELVGAGYIITDISDAFDGKQRLGDEHRAYQIMQYHLLSREAERD